MLVEMIVPAETAAETAFVRCVESWCCRLPARRRTSDPPQTPAPGLRDERCTCLAHSAEGAVCLRLLLRVVW